MTTVYCFSGSGHSRTVATAFAEQLHGEVSAIEPSLEPSTVDGTAVVVFPVYCQNIPAPVKRFLKALSAPYVVLIATYGRISYGNVLYEAAQLVHGTVIAAACVPIGHTFRNGDHRFDMSPLLPILKRIQAPQAASVPRSHKVVYADLFPALRSRLSVRLRRLPHCAHCGLCEARCPVGAMRNGRIRSSCIRCLRCVTECPKQALQFHNSRLLKRYLDTHRKEETVVHL